MHATYRIPSFLSDREWQFTIRDQSNVQWDAILRAWKEEGVFGNLPATSLKSPIGSFQDFSDLHSYDLRIFDVPIAKSSSWHTFSEEGKPTTWKDEGTWSIWGDIGRASKTLKAGVFRRKGLDWLLIVVGGKNLGSDDVMPMIPLAGAEREGFSARRNVWYDQSAVFMRRIDDATSPWYLLAGSLTATVSPNEFLGNPNGIFAAWNQAARRIVGMQSAGQPFAGFAPFFEAAKEKFGPVMLLRLDRDAAGRQSPTVLRVLLGSEAPRQQISIGFDWTYHWRDEYSTDETGSQWSFTGKIDPGEFPEQFKLAWRAGTLANTADELLAMLETAQPGVDELEPRPLAQFALSDLELVGTKSIRIGSMLLVPQKMGGEARLNVELRGRWTGQHLDIYPVIDFSGLICNVQPTSGADRLAEYAQLDSPDPLSDERQRDSGPIVFRLEPPPPLEVELVIRSRFETGRNAVSEIKLISSSPSSRFGEESIYLQMRPFTVAKAYPADLDPQAGSQIAVWRSDDPDGPQWRLADATVLLDLPPQAVGEEMERGNRFWDGKKSYIPTTPIRYRFSPPTRLVVKPAQDRERRYNVSPYNVSSALRSAKVEAFRTEVVYPVQTYFQVSERGLPDVRIAEASFFLASPAPNMPTVDNDTARKEFELGKVFSRELAKYAAPIVSKQFYKKYAALRLGQTAVRMNVASRLSEHRLFDPWRSDRGLDLHDGLRSEIRSFAQGGAPPMISPLPGPADLRGVDKNELNINNFLKTGDWVKDGDQGSLRAGVLYTIEFASELRAILRDPVATETLLEKLAFTPLGANAKVAVSFDEGRTTFTAEVVHGQVSKLIRTRIGRVALLWNKAKHVVVYQRDVVHSDQFHDEQESSPHLGRPILRKWEEYVEPIERVRLFTSDAHKELNLAGMVEGSEFVSRSIYVNGAWGHDLYQDSVPYGYEIPLWNEHDRSGFYPRPDFALRAHAGGDTVNRLTCSEPHNLYFYSNAEKGTGNDPDKWEPKEGVDGTKDVPRMSVVTSKPFRDRAPAEKMDLMRKAAIPPARLGGLRRPRFDLAVFPEAVVNVQHGRGEKPVLCTPTIVSLSRTNSEAPVDTTQWPKDKRDAFEKLEGLVRGNSEVAAVAEDFARMSEQLPKMLYELAMDCKTVKAKVIEELDKRYSAATIAIKEVPQKIDAGTLKEATAYAIMRMKERAAWKIKAELNAPVNRLQDITQALREEIKMLAASRAEQLDDGKRALIEVLNSPLDAALAAYEAMEAARVKARDQLSAEVEALLDAAIAEAQKASDELQRAQATIIAFAKTINAASQVEPLKTEALKYIDQLSEALKSVRATIELAQDKLAGIDGAGVVGIVVQAAMKTLRDIEHQTEMVGASLADVRANLEETTASLDTVRNFLLARVTDPAKSVAEGFALSKGIVDAALAYTAAVRTTLLDGLRDRFDNFATPLTKVKDALKEMREVVKRAIQAPVGQLRDRVLEAEQVLVSRLDGAVVELARGYQKDLESDLQDTIGTALDATGKAMLEGVMTVGAKLNELSRDLNLEGKRTAILDWLRASYERARAIINDPALDCSQLDKLGEAARSLRVVLQSTRDDVEAKVTRTINALVDDAARKHLEGLQVPPEAQAALGKGIKLVKLVARFDWRSLAVNAAEIECVMADKDPAILTSPFVAKLKELEGGLQDLSLAVPCEKLLEQLVPASLQGVDFNAVFKKFGGIDFGEFFRKFKLPDLDSKSIRISQGVDRATQKAWLKAEVDKTFREEQELLAIAPFAMRTADMHLSALSDVQVSKDGTTHSVIDAHLKANWILDFGGARLATFKQVTVSYDGSSFGFNISPNNIELHPAVQFAAEFARQMGESMPPGIEFEKDHRGMPVGVRANFAAVVRDLPPMGPVFIGPMQILSGFGLRIQEDGKFVVSTHVSVGSRAAPVFVQIGYLGGGLWLEAQADLIGGQVQHRATVGLALGAMRAFTLGGVARGNFAILLFAYAEVSSAGGSLRAGALLTAHVRILGICSAGISLLLEVQHANGGDTSGHGELEVEVEICWCYTLHVQRSVNHQF